MATNKRSEHLRYRYGICLNDNCQKCKDKEIQQITSRKDFVCEECGKPLRECPPPKKGPNKIVIGSVLGVVVLAIIGGIIFFWQGNQNTPAEGTAVSVDSAVPVVPQRDTVIVEKTDTVRDTVKVVNNNTTTITTKEVVTHKQQSVPTNTPKAESRPATTTGPKVSYGNYSGPSNGLGGTISVTRSYTLDLRKGDGTCLELEPGDQIQQTKFQDGDLKQGIWIHQGARRFFTR